MAAHRYWRLVGFATYGGGALELSEARLYAGGSAVDAAATLTCSGSPTAGTLADLKDGSAASAVLWPKAVYSASGFALTWDLGGGGGASVDGIRIGSGSSINTFPCLLALQWSDDAVAWTTYAAAVGAVYPGAFSLTAPDPAGDPYFTANAALLHFDDVDGSTSIVDVMGKTWTAFYSAALSTAWSAFGASSLRLGDSKQIRTPSHSDFDLGSGDFTISLTVRIVTVDAGGYMAFFSRDLIGGTRGWVCTTEPGAGLGFGVNIGATSYGVLDPVVFSPGDTVNYVFGRDNGYLRMYKNGVQVSATAISGSINSSGTPLVMGALWNTSGAISGVSPNVYIDEFRICKAAIYPNGTTFTPSTVPWVDFSSGVMQVDSAAPKSVGRIPVPASRIPGSPRPVGAASPAIRTRVFADAYHGGLGTIVGTVKEKNLPSNTPLHRRVLLLDERSKIVIREEWSDAVTGNYEFRGIKLGVPYTVLSYDHTHGYRAVVADNITPELLP